MYSRGLSELGIGSPMGRNVRGKKITPSGGVRVAGPTESGNAGKLELRDKFPREIDRCLKACRSYDKIKQTTEESRLANRSYSWGRLGSPGVRDRCGSNGDRSTEKRTAINNLRGARLHQKRTTQIEVEAILSPKNGTRAKFKSSMAKSQTSFLPEKSCFKSPKKIPTQLQDWLSPKHEKQSELKRAKSPVENLEKKKKKHALYMLNDHIRKINAENVPSITLPKPKKKSLKQYVLNMPSQSEESQLRKNRNFKKTIDGEQKKPKLIENVFNSVEEDVDNFLSRKHSTKFKMSTVQLQPMLMPTKDIGYAVSPYRMKSPTSKSKKTLSFHTVEPPPSLKEKISEMMFKRKSNDSQLKSKKKPKIKNLAKRIPKSPTNEMVSTIIDFNRAKSSKILQKPMKKKKVQKKMMASKKPEMIEINGRLYHLKEVLKPSNKKRNDSSSNHEYDQDLNHDSDRMKPRLSVSSDEDARMQHTTPQRPTPSRLFASHKHGQPSSGIKDITGIQSHVDVEDVVGGNTGRVERESENNGAPEKPVRIPAYNASNQTVEEPAQYYSVNQQSNSGSRKQNKLSHTSQKSNHGNSGSKDFGGIEGESLVVIEQSNDQQVKRIDESIQVSLYSNKKSERDAQNSPKVDSQVNCVANLMQYDIKLEQLAKDEYQKWAQVNNMVKQIEEKLGPKAATDIKDMFSKLDMFASKSKKNLKEAFLASDFCTSNQLSEIRTRRSEDIGAIAAREPRGAAIFDNSNKQPTLESESRNNSARQTVGF